MFRNYINAFLEEESENKQSHLGLQALSLIQAVPTLSLENNAVLNPFVPSQLSQLR